MSSSKKKKKYKAAEAFDINVTPMVDMFSVLISFLLITAVFSATGQARVDVPFLSSRPPEDQKDEDKDPPVNLTVVIQESKVELEVTGGKIGEKPETHEYQLVEAGLDELQAKVYQYRKDDLRVDTVTLLTDENIKYDKLVMVLDAVRVLKPNRDPIPVPADYKFPRGVDQEALIPKIIMGNVIL
jgi:biopolymer transport protein ExbD